MAKTLAMEVARMKVRRRMIIGGEGGAPWCSGPVVSSIIQDSQSTLVYQQ